MQGYTETIRKYAASTIHTGLLENPDGTGEVGLSSAEVGNRLAVRFTIKVTNQQIAKVRFQVFGCGFTIAACAAAAELSEGHSLTEIQSYTPATIIKTLAGLPEERRYCADLAHEALQAAVVSVNNAAQTVQTDLHPAATKKDQDPNISINHPVYKTLLASKHSAAISADDRQLFACLLSVASSDPYPLTEALGLSKETINRLLSEYFPGVTYPDLATHQAVSTEPMPEINEEVRKILLSHVPHDVTGGRNRTAEWLARAIAARSSQPGHLWCAMGFFERSMLTAAIRRHLPTLAAANSQGMRWKRYLFKQACELNGGRLCKSPSCGNCSDFALCFAPEKD